MTCSAGSPSSSDHHIDFGLLHGAHRPPFASAFGAVALRWQSFNMSTPKFDEGLERALLLTMLRTKEVVTGHGGSRARRKIRSRHTFRL